MPLSDAVTKTIAEYIYIVIYIRDLLTAKTIVECIIVY